MARRYTEYLREDMFPQMWCAGCSHGITISALARAMAALGLEPSQTVVVTGIGCFGKADDYFNTHVFHGTHGRALSFATGIKVANPRLHVLVLMGDGDGVTIGGNHFIHTARRNLDLTVVLANNKNYGMTGGQYSATSPEGSLTATSPWGTVEPEFDICNLAKAAGATFVARTTAYHVLQMEKLLVEAISHKGFSLVEVLSACPTYYSRYNGKMSAVETMRFFRDRSVTREKYDALPEDEKGKYILTGKLHVEEKDDFHAKYAQLQQKARQAKAGGKL